MLLFGGRMFKPDWLPPRDSNPDMLGLQEIARENGKKGGRPPKKKESN